MNPSGLLLFKEHSTDTWTVWKYQDRVYLWSAMQCKSSFLFSNNILKEKRPIRISFFEEHQESLQNCWIKSVKGKVREHNSSHLRFKKKILIALKIYILLCKIGIIKGLTLSQTVDKSDTGQSYILPFPSFPVYSGELSPSFSLLYD